MMVETILESSQDFGMSNGAGALPQWKRELLQRRLARARPAPPAPPPPPPPPPADDDEELRYGPGIVKRLKSRYLSLALRDAPRRRPSSLRRAASLEHLLDERPPPDRLRDERPPPAPRRRPASLAPLPPPPREPRRDLVKRARSVDALSRLERDEPPPSPEPCSPAPLAPPAAPVTRAPRPPRRPQPLLREAERPPPDVVRSALRKFESAPPRRAAPAARQPAVLRSLEPRRSPTPDDPPASHAPAPRTPPPSEPEPAPEPENPAPAPEPEPTPPSPPRSPAPTTPEPKIAPAAPRVAPPSPSPPAGPPPTGTDEAEGGATRRVSRAALEEIARAGSSVRYAFPAARAADHLPPPGATNPVLLARGARRVGVIRPMPAVSPPAPRERAAVNGHSTPEPAALSRIGAAGIERAWSGSPSPPAAGARRARAPPPAATSIVFNFSDRKDVPDYIENDGIILRASRRARIKPGEPGVVVLRPELVNTGSGSEGEEDAGPPSPCDVRFVNDNVLINGKSSMPNKPNKDRIAKLKLQFDDSLTRTFEYPSETSLCEDPSPPAPPAPPAPAAPPCAAPADAPPTLHDNTHIASAALSRYTPSKSCAAAFQLGLAPSRPPPAMNGDTVDNGGAPEDEEGEGAESAGGAGGAAQSWSDARAQRTDLLF